MNASGAGEQPSRRIVEQRMRNRVIEYLELVASFDEQRRYEAAAPIAHVPAEVFEQWHDWMPIGPDDKATPPSVYLPEEVDAVHAFDDVWNGASAELPRQLPSLRECLELPQWSRLREAAATTLDVLARRGPLPEDREA